MNLSKSALRSSALFLGATFVVLGLAEIAQTVGPPIDQVYPGPLGMANFGKIISGEFTGDLKRDAVVMDDSQPKLLVAPETYDTAIDVGGPANDIATLSGVLPGKDCVLTVSAAGLLRYERNSANGTWIVTTLRDSASSWGGARKVAVGHVAGTSLSDIVGIAADGRTVLIEYANFDGSYTRSEE